MIVRRTSLTQALDELEAGTLPGVSTLVVSRSWWDALPIGERRAYRARAGRTGVKLRSDALMTSHFVEARDREDGPPLSSERPM